MNVNDVKEEDPGQHVLGDKELVAHVSEWCESGQICPKQKSPSSEAVINHWHDADLLLHNVGSDPLRPKVPAMDRSCHKHRPGYPSVQPIESFVAATNDPTQNAALGGEQVQ